MVASSRGVSCGGSVDGGGGGSCCLLARDSRPARQAKASATRRSRIWIPDGAEAAQCVHASVSPARLALSRKRWRRRSVARGSSPVPSSAGPAARRPLLLKPAACSLASSWPFCLRPLCGQIGFHSGALHCRHLAAWRRFYTRRNAIRGRATHNAQSAL